MLCLMAWKCRFCELIWYEQESILTLEKLNNNNLVSCSLVVSFMYETSDLIILCLGFLLSYHQVRPK